LLSMTNSVNIVEIGAECGLNTLKILEYCKQNKGLLHVIDPVPLFGEKSIREKYRENFRMYVDYSLNALVGLKDYHAVLIDGDHNWYTVYNELKIIEKNTGAWFPLVFIHDIAWPYGRRDMYYQPGSIPQSYRKPYAKRGMEPGRSELLEVGGYNKGYNNAMYEYGERNGVLTAVEDFLKQSSCRIDFLKTKRYNGLGILMAEERSKLLAEELNKLPYWEENYNG